MIYISLVLCLFLLELSGCNTPAGKAWTPVSSTENGEFGTVKANTGEFNQLTAVGIVTGSINSEGNVGIGISNPIEKLEVAGKIKVVDLCTTQGECLSTAGGVDSWTASGANINRPSGNVGIGISAPSEKLQVEGNIKATGLKGTGNAYACVDANGKIFRSQTACI